MCQSGMTAEQAVGKMKLSKPLLSEIENYQYLQRVLERERMNSIEECLHWYNNKDVVLTLEARKKMIAFCHNKNIDLLKLGYTLPTLLTFVNISLPMQKFIRSPKDKKIRWKRSGKILWAGRWMYSPAKRSLTKLSFKNWKIFANQFLV